MINRKVLFTLILLAIIFRFIGLNYAPPHLSNDEIGAAYTAYSILETTRDGEGKVLPLLWKSHGGYGSPGAIYLPLISVLFFGNNDFAVRLPSAILGSLTVILLGLLVKQITKNNNLAIVSLFLIAISPWHFLASHSALESNYALFFIVLGLYLFFVGLSKRNNLATLTSFIAFALSMYSYYAEWVLTPLILLSLLFTYRSVILKRKIYYVAVILFGILLVPLFIGFVHNLSSSRASSEFITKDIGVGRLLSGYSSTIKRGQIIFKAVVDKYSAYSGLDYLFFNGAKILPKENPYQFGFFLTPFLVTFILGLFKLRDYYGKNSKFIYLLLIVSPLVAAMTEGELNNWRSLPQLLPVTLIAGAGTLYFWDRVKSNFLVKIIAWGLLLISSVYFFFVYFRHFPLQRAVDYQYGYKQMALFINKHYGEYEKIIIDQRFGDKNYYYVGVPSSYIPFYTYLDPIKVQNAVRIPNGITFDKYEFRNINWNSEKIEKDYLYIIPYDILPNPEYDLKLVHEVNLPNWQPAFRFYSLVD